MIACEMEVYYMPYDGYGGDEGFPHDGKQWRCGCDEGYRWDDNDGGYGGGSHKGSSGGGNGTGLLIFAICLASAVGVFNELLGVIILFVSFLSFTNVKVIWEEYLNF